MKHLCDYITESSSDDCYSGLKNFFKMFATCASGVQRAYYEQMLRDIKPVEVVPMSDVFTESEIKEIVALVNPIPKQCYVNAWKFVESNPTDHKVEYVEGYTSLYGVPIEHAFNVVDGKHYVDITVEYALESPLDGGYASLGTFSDDTVRKCLIENEYYGEIYKTIFRHNYEEKKIKPSKKKPIVVDGIRI